MDYWNDRFENIKTAKKHTDEADEIFTNEINNAIKETKIYDDNHEFVIIANKCKPIIKLWQLDTFTALNNVYVKNPDKNISILNFASFKEPGGKFLSGSTAQEEDLCHKSFLFNVLRSFQSFYNENNKHKNKGLYINRGLFSPNILFYNHPKEIISKANVITLAAPNKSLLYKYGSFTEEDNTKALKSRMDFLFKIVSENPCDYLILGAWGCGVFRQDVNEVLDLFKENILKYSNVPNIIFAVPDNDTFNKFVEYPKRFAQTIQKIIL